MKIPCITRFCLLALPLFVSFLVSSCNSREENVDKIVIGFSQGIWSHPFRYQMNDAIEIEASLYSDIELITKVTDAKPEEQIEQIEELIELGVDVLIVSPVDEVSLNPTIQKARNTGIPIILLDRKISSEDYDVFIGADNLEIGRAAANRIVSQRNSQNNIIELIVDDNASPSVERRVGFRQVITKSPNSKIVATFRFDDMNGLANYLNSENGKIVDYVFAFNDFIAHQAYKIAKLNGLESSIKFIGIDGLNIPDGGVDLVKRGILDASILYPNGAKEAIMLARKIIDREEVPKNYTLETTVIDSSNAEIMENQLNKISEQQKVIEEQVGAIKVQESEFNNRTNLLYLVIILLAGIIVLFGYSLNSFFRLRKNNQLLIENNEKIIIQKNQLEKNTKLIEESNAAKMNFFTGLSHEFKTPLTLILSSVESMLQETKRLPASWKNEVDLISNNSNRLLRLINQLLDFRKVEEREFTLKASKTNLTTFTQNIYQDFEREAKRRNINFTLYTNNPGLEVFIDRNLFDKVYFNLLSNAFKFTPDNGAIFIEIKDDPESNHCEITVGDSGIGIPKDEVDQLFEPFFKGSNNRKKSSGIGLYLTRIFVELHKGSIEVKADKGTRFYLSILKGNAHLDEDEIIYLPESIQNNVIDYELELTQGYDQSTEVIVPSPKDLNKLLLIEDNIDLSEYLTRKLSNHYEVVRNLGEKPLEDAFDIIPDIIICDINLPDISGYEICKALKNDIRTSHIPIIILTAFSDNVSYIEGMKSGADLYLTKPFSFSVLLQSIQSLVYNREKLRYYFTNNFFRLGKGKIHSQDEMFLINLEEMIAKNLDNSLYNVEQLANDLDLSRVQLYRKVKALMGISVSDYLTNYRLDYAKTLLLNSDQTISEIAYASGFSSPNYFATLFKRKYESSPNSFRKQKS